MTVRVSIGRNIGPVPMDDGLWAAFLADVVRVMTAIVGAPDEVKTSEHDVVWVAADGTAVAEMSRTLASFGDNNDPATIERLRLALCGLCATYHQDQIAIDPSTTVFATPA